MAGKISLGISVVLLALVGYMWSKIGSQDEVDTSNTTEQEAPESMATSGADLSVAFIDEDSLFAKYQYVIDKQPGLVSRLERKQKTLQTNAMSFERDAGLLQQAAQAGQITEAEYEMQVAVLQRQEQTLQKQQQDIQQMELDFLNAVQERVKESIDDYCAANNIDLLLSHNATYPIMIYRDGVPNVTDEVVAQLNQEYLIEEGDE